YIDAEKQNGKDEVFIILIEKQNGDVIETTYTEETSHSEIRTISINFEEGDSKIQVIGTYVIPEFGTIVMIILTVGIMASVLLTRNRFQIKI
ncbi:MAG: PEFG-CTERM sorting domain-containing protein, partial [Nitrosopumilus sp.]